MASPPVAASGEIATLADVKEYYVKILHYSDDLKTCPIDRFRMPFFTFDRKSNLVPDTANKTSHLLREQIVVGTKGLLLTLNWNKTIQFDQRHLITPVVSAHILSYVHSQHIEI